MVIVVYASEPFIAENWRRAGWIHFVARISVFAFGFPQALEITRSCQLFCRSVVDYKRILQLDAKAINALEGV